MASLMHGACISLVLFISFSLSLSGSRMPECPSAPSRSCTLLCFALIFYIHFNERWHPWDFGHHGMAHAPVHTLTLENKEIRRRWVTAQAHRRNHRTKKDMYCRLAKEWEADRRRMKNENKKYLKNVEGEMFKRCMHIAHRHKSAKVQIHQHILEREWPGHTQISESQSGWHVPIGSTKIAFIDNRNWPELRLIKGRPCIWFNLQFARYGPKYTFNVDTLLRMNRADYFNIFCLFTLFTFRSSHCRMV